MRKPPALTDLLKKALDLALEGRRCLAGQGALDSALVAAKVGARAGQQALTLIGLATACCNGRGGFSDSIGFEEGSVSASISPLQIGLSTSAGG